MNFALIADRIAVKLDEPEKESKGGIILPDRSQSVSCEGTVVAVGPGLFSETLGGKYIAMSVKVGNRVIVEKYNQREIEVDGEKLIVLHEGEVLAILPSKERK